MAGTWKFFVDEKQWHGTRDLYIRAPAPAGKIAAITNLMATVLESGEAMAPTLSDSYEDIQDNNSDVEGFLRGAMQAAWDLGMRPKGFEDHNNELTAVRYHLEDMRLLAKVRK